MPFFLVFSVECNDFSSDVGSDDAFEGKVTTRIPETDWPDNPFIQGIELVSSGFVFIFIFCLTPFEFRSVQTMAVL